MKDLTQLFRQEIGWWNEKEMEPTRHRRVFRSSAEPGPHRLSAWKLRQIKQRKKLLRDLALLLVAHRDRKAYWERYWRVQKEEKRRVDKEVRERVQKYRRRYRAGENPITDRLRRL